VEIVLNGILKKNNINNRQAAFYSGSYDPWNRCMTISQDDRNALCELRLEQMRTAAHSCKLLLENGDMQGTANRMYYAVFYAISALAISQGKSFSKHGTLIGWFNKDFVLTGVFDRS
jgi:hypothetical protein